MATENRDIKYLNKDFGELRNSLIEFAKTYFPSTYNDFSPSSPGMMFMLVMFYHFILIIKFKKILFNSPVNKIISIL